MRWSLKIGRVSGIGLYLHITLLLLLALIAYTGFADLGARGAVWSLALVVAILACIMLHELGHSLVAQRLGMQVKSITLLPIGGVAALKGFPEKPWQEIVITLAGPMVNLVIAVLLLPFTGVPRQLFFLSIPYNLPSFLQTLVAANLTLFVFNFIPAFPMDGGRLVRGMLSLVMSFQRATVVAAVMGQVLAILFVLVGLTYRPLWLLAVIGVFIFLSAEGEERMVRTRALLRDLEVEEVMARDFVVLAPSATVMRGLEMVYHTGQDDFPVMDGAQYLGIVTRQAMLDAANRRGAETPVSEVMNTQLPAVPPHTKLDRVYEMMMTEGYSSLPVEEEGRLVGLLAHENVSRYLMVQSQLRAPRLPAAGGHMSARPLAREGVLPVATPRSHEEPPPPTDPA